MRKIGNEYNVPSMEVKVMRRLFVLKNQAKVCTCVVYN